ncbi:hypothetical protein V6N13_040441 [Hibiscus sabdariffa]|uniref:Transmembrane protein n=1 Tax=Hibiscus sabdariffa TaxID=183260 RepID=A0ABR2R8V5_9ROSI
MPSSVDENNELPVYDPNVEMTNKKEKSRAKFTENDVHIIPLVLIVCALIFDVEMGAKVETVGAKIDGLTIDGDIDNDSDGTQTGFLPIAEVGNVESTKHSKHKNHSRKLHIFYHLNP